MPEEAWCICGHTRSNCQCQKPTIKKCTAYEFVRSNVKFIGDYTICRRGPILEKNVECNGDENSKYCKHNKGDIR